MENQFKNHWETVYGTKKPEEVSWTQQIPKTSLAFIKNCLLPKSASIIDIGGGDSNLVDFLLEEGYSNITILDISSKALDRAKERLGEKGRRVTWIVSDITEFTPETSYDIWHDRATFHFLTSGSQIEKYVGIAERAIRGYLILGTFSENGPVRCSGLEIKQYNEEQMKMQFQGGFQKMDCLTEDHLTPFNTIQNFLFCRFKKI